jgi:hypothetical protein
MVAGEGIKPTIGISHEGMNLVAPSGAVPAINLWSPYRESNSGFLLTKEAVCH